MIRHWGILPLCAACMAAPALAQEATQAETAQQAPGTALQQLRHVVGTWDVVTEFLRSDGSVAGVAEGTYEFAWVVEDKVVQGVSRIPEFGMASGILFYLRPGTNEVEMVSVGADGQLWVMTGPQNSETRQTPVVTMPDGTTLKLRFTRFNVSENRFESRMERSTDGGETWGPGNHQVFMRRVDQPAA